MKKILTLLAMTSIFAGAAQALEFPFFSVADSAHAARRRAAPAREEARNDEGMQAVCREILVDTDEGYGVTSKESRIICDELR
ncbi:hypothetical protein LG047_16295 [Methylocystis sp. WRRC1]|uniref:hypothetical protein n=1 Tax=unclassified Methylocystis TaxID=2625913 RepID=UPI0001F86F0D|nr:MULTISPECIES: hypothetical protein [unclassified Methylocystis]MCC3246858.1 hypothetical protein [Methylocystis sp. WRRC1]